jgi:hypothetical protein
VGPAVIAMGEATCDRAMIRPLAQQLAQHFTVIHYVRRRRSDRSDTAPYAVEREIEELATLMSGLNHTLKEGIE